MAETLAAVTHTHTHTQYIYGKVNENKIENSIRISSVCFDMNKKSYV